MHGHFPKASLASTMLTILLAVVVAAGALGIAIATRYTSLALDAGWEMAPTYRAGDNPWRYAWSAPRDTELPPTAVSATRTPEGAASLIFAPVAEVQADNVTVGDRLTLSELTRPDRFGWPAVFICRRHPGDTKAIVLSANDPDEMNKRLLAAGIWPEDCHGGFSIRSVRTDSGKLSEIEGRAERAPSDTATDQTSVRGR